MKNYSIVDRQFVDLKTNTIGAGVTITDNTQTEKKKFLLLWVNFINELTEKLMINNWEAVYHDEIADFNTYQKKRIQDISITTPQETVQLALNSLYKNMYAVLRNLQMELVAKGMGPGMNKEVIKVYLN